ncbi:hypothetical protein Taro_022637 [Colocasia esculenta]|uniref:Uncharacterized protein n=1 Tax=Colocasia esculenta TaxID=4460 RepID=A0A843VF31_COLES|nr:hypothetical protein [Colocasia esculenta]
MDHYDSFSQLLVRGSCSCGENKNLRSGFPTFKAGAFLLEGDSFLLLLVPRLPRAPVTRGFLLLPGGFWVPPVYWHLAFHRKKSHSTHGRPGEEKLKKG